MERHCCCLRNQNQQHKTSCCSQSTHFTGTPFLNVQEPRRRKHFTLYDGWSKSAALVQQTCSVCWLWISVFIWDFISFHFGFVWGLISGGKVTSWFVWWKSWWIADSKDNRYCIHQNTVLFVQNQNVKAKEKIWVLVQFSSHCVDHLWFIITHLCC